MVGCYLRTVAGSVDGDMKDGKRAAGKAVDMIGQRSRTDQRIDIRRDQGTVEHMFPENRPCCTWIACVCGFACTPLRFTLDALLKRDTRRSVKANSEFQRFRCLKIAC